MTVARAIAVCGALLAVPLVAVVLSRRGAAPHGMSSSDGARAPIAEAPVSVPEERPAHGPPAGKAEVTPQTRPATALGVAPNVTALARREHDIERLAAQPPAPDEDPSSVVERPMVAAGSIDRLKGADLSAFARVRPQSAP